MLTKHLEVSTWTDESKIEESTTALEWARKSRFIPRLFLTLSMLTATPTLITSCTDDPNEPDNPEVIDERDLQIRFTSGNIDISQSPTIKIEGNTLQVWYNTIAERSKNTPHKEVKIFYSPDKSFTNATEIHNWTILTDNMEWNYIWLKVTYTNWKEKEWRSTWKLTDNITSQIERLKNLNYKVDEPIDLTLWGTLNVKQASFEIDWEVIPLEPSNAIFPWPWNWILHFTIIKSDWTTKDQDININVKPMDHNDPYIKTANFSKNYEFYSNLEYQKDFLHDYIIISMCVNGVCYQPIRVMLWESFDEDHNIWIERNINWHWTRWKNNISLGAPDAEILGCYSIYDNGWGELDNFLKQNPYKNVVVSCAEDVELCWTFTGFDSIPDIKALKNVINKPNVYVICAVGNGRGTYRIANNENKKEYNSNEIIYNSSSVNSKNYKNKATIRWYNAKNKNNNCFWQNWGTNSLMPSWYKLEEWNVVIPFTAWVTLNGFDDPTTDSSFPTSNANGFIWTILWKIMSNHKLTYITDAADIFQYYFNNSKIEYKDKNGNIVESNDYEYPINTEKFINDEILHIPEIKNTQYNSEIVELPNYEWLWYTGKWIMFEYNWTLHEMNDKNKAKLYEMFHAWEPIKRTLNTTISRKKWWDSFLAFPVDKDWEKVPDTEYTHYYRTTISKP